MSSNETPADELSYSRDARIILATLFGLGRSSSVTYHMRESRPTPRAQAALDELVAAQAISVEDANGFGGKTYKPLIDAMPYFRWLHTNEGEIMPILREFRLTEPIKNDG